ncbi:MAG: FAD-dependent oxidoreductase [Candidatus Micrarchaeia archaeon]
MVKEYNYDVVVIGGGPAGIGAAFSAAELGLSTALIERHNMLGGNWTNGYVLSILGIYTYSGNTKIVGGIADKVVEQLKNHKGTNGKVGNFIPFRPDEMKLTLNEMAEKLNIKIYYSALVNNVYMKDNIIESVEFIGKNGVNKIKGKVFIDASGDADLAHILHNGVMVGNGKEEIHQEATLPFRISNIDESKVIKHAKEHPDEISVTLDDQGKLSRIRILQKLVVKAIKEKKLYLPHTNNEFLFNTCKQGEFVCNATHVNVTNFADSRIIAEEIENARKQVISSLNFLIENIEGFENAYLIDSAPYIGLRETRRAIGEYILKKDEVVGNARFEDKIARCGHPIEIHDLKKGVYYIHLNNGDDSYYEIPYRSIVIKNIKNAFVVGRCLSAEFEAQASARVSGTSMAMGQAAATAAYLMIKQNKYSLEINIKELQELLKKNGAIL